MHKFTDTEIIGTLELIANDQNSNFLRIVLDLINRLNNNSKTDNRIIELQDKKIAEQQAEIRKLQKEVNTWKHVNAILGKRREQISIKQ